MPATQRTSSKEDIFQIFTSQDAVLEETTEANVERYINAGGGLPDVCDALMDSYMGVPDMIRVLVDWGNVYGDGEATLQNAVETVVNEHEQKIIPRLDETFAITDDPQMLIASLVSSQRWSSVVKEIASRFKQSTLHNLVTREARLSEANISQRVLNSPEEFLESLTSQFEKQLQSNTSVDNESLEELYKRIVAVSTYDECSTVVALRFFSTLTQKAKDPKMRGTFRRIGQEIRKEAVHLMTSASMVSAPVAWQYIMKLTLITDSVAFKVDHPKEIADAMLIIAAPDKTTKRRYDRETKILTQEYACLIGSLDIADEVEEVNSTSESKRSISEKAMLIRMPCHAEIIEDLIKSLFSYEYRSTVDGKPDESKRRCLCLLLAYVGIFLRINDRVLLEELKEEEKIEEWSKEVGRLFKILHSVVLVCEELKPGCLRSQMKGAPIQKLVDALKNPLLARGILIWAREGIQGGSDLRDLMVTATKHLAFLQVIAKEHPILRSQIIDIIHTAFKREYPSLDITEVEELRDKFMATILGMMRFDMGIQFIDTFIEKWVKDETVDNAHVRKFTIELLKTVAPPYTEGFAKAIARLLDNRRVASLMPKDPKVISLIREFREVQKRMGI